MDFPNLGRYDLLYKTNLPLPVEGLSLEGSILKKIEEKDYLVNAPYQSFSYIIKFLREAALARCLPGRSFLHRRAFGSRPAARSPDSP